MTLKSTRHSLRAIVISAGFLFAFLTIRLLWKPLPSFAGHAHRQSLLIIEEDYHIFDVIIVGAGWAGISAASKLYAENMHNFVILEGRETYGGRSRTKYPFSKAPGLAVELGSAWLYEGTEHHERMLELQQPYGRVHPDDPSTFGLYSPEGGEITDKKELKHYHRVWKSYCKYSEEACSRGTRDG